MAIYFGKTLILPSFSDFPFLSFSLRVFRVLYLAYCCSGGTVDLGIVIC